jgi:RimJ/RimL family protein N-acetyltransferase
LSRRRNPGAGARSRLDRLRDATRTLPARRRWRVFALWPLCRRFLVLTADAAEESSAKPERDDARFTHRSADGGDIETIRAVNPFLTDLEIRRRFAEGQRCALHFRDGSPVYVRWFSMAAVELGFLGLRYLPGPGDAMLLDAMTRPGARGRGVTRRVVRASADAMREAGARRLVTLIAWWNEPSLRLARKTHGFRESGSVTRWGLGPIRFYSVSGAAAVEDGILRIGPG